MEKSKSIEIALKATQANGNQRKLPSSINQILQQEYATKYLENIGVDASRENIEYVTNSLPVKEALILPVWVREKLVILPGRIDKQRDLTSVMHDLNSENSVEVMSHSRRKKTKGVRFSSKKRSQKKKMQKVADASGYDSLESSGGGLDMDSITENDEDESDENPSGDDDTVQPIINAQAEKEAFLRYANKGRRLSWSTVATTDALVEPLLAVVHGNRKVAESFKGLVDPPVFQTEDILGPVHIFLASLGDYVPSARNDTTMTVFRNIREYLISPHCVRLYGLLCHFCYWNVLHPTARATMSTIREQSIVVDGRATPAFFHANLYPQNDASRRSSILPKSMQDDMLLEQEMLQSREDYYGKTSTNADINAAAAAAAAAIGIDPHSRHSFMQLNEAFSVPEDREASPPPLSSGGGIGAPLFLEGMHTSTSTQHQLQQQQQGSATAGGPRTNSRERDKRLLASDRNSSPGGNDDLDETSTIHTARSNRGISYVDNGKVLNARARDSSARTVAAAGGGGDDDIAGGEQGQQSRNGNNNRGFGDTYGEIQGDTSLSGWSSTSHSRGGGASGMASEVSLSGTEREQLFLQLEACLIRLNKKMGHRRISLIAGRQALVSCCHFVVDDMLTRAFPWFSAINHELDDDTAELNKKKDKQRKEQEGEGASVGQRRRSSSVSALKEKPKSGAYDEHVVCSGAGRRGQGRAGGSLGVMIHDYDSDDDAPQLPRVLSRREIKEAKDALSKSIRDINKRLRRLIHQSIADIIDPSRIYTSAMLMFALTGRHQAVRAKGRAKYHCTSAAVKSVFGDTTSYKVRKFLHYSDPPYTNLPGVPGEVKDAQITRGLDIDALSIFQPRITSASGGGGGTADVRGGANFGSRGGLGDAVGAGGAQQGYAQSIDGSLSMQELSYRESIESSQWRSPHSSNASVRSSMGDLHSLHQAQGKRVANPLPEPQYHRDSSSRGSLAADALSVPSAASLGGRYINSRVYNSRTDNVAYGGDFKQVQENVRKRNLLRKSVDLTSGLPGAASSRDTNDESAIDQPDSASWEEGSDVLGKEIQREQFTGSNSPSKPLAPHILREKKSVAPTAVAAAAAAARIADSTAATASASSAPSPAVFLNMDSVNYIPASLDKTRGSVQNFRSNSVIGNSSKSRPPLNAVPAFSDSPNSVPSLSSSRMLGLGFTIPSHSGAAAAAGSTFALPSPLSYPSPSLMARSGDGAMAMNGLPASLPRLSQEVSDEADPLFPERSLLYPRGELDFTNIFADQPDAMYFPTISSEGALLPHSSSAVGRRRGSQGDTSNLSNALSLESGIVSLERQQYQRGHQLPASMRSAVAGNAQHRRRHNTTNSARHEEDSFPFPLPDTASMASDYVHDPEIDRIVKGLDRQNVVSGMKNNRFRLHGGVAAGGKSTSAEASGGASLSSALRARGNTVANRCSNRDSRGVLGGRGIRVGRGGRGGREERGGKGESITYPASAVSRALRPLPSAPSTADNSRATTVFVGNTDFRMTGASGALVSAHSGKERGVGGAKGAEGVGGVHNKSFTGFRENNDEEEEDMMSIEQSVNSVSQGSIGSRSLAYNPHAKVQLSLRAKATLMDLMVDKTTTLYKVQVRTRFTENRIALLEGDDAAARGLSEGHHRPLLSAPRKVDRIAAAAVSAVAKSPTGARGK